MRKSVLITGASRGIGRATAKLFASAGYRVGVNYLHSDEAAEALVREIRLAGGDACALRADVSDHAAVQAMADAFGRVDVLVNNAGISAFGLLQETTPEAWRRMFAVHVDGAYNCCHCVLPQMIGRQEGCILNVSSMWGRTGASCEVAYSAAKAALIGFTKALAKEAGPSGVRVNCVAPGVIDTDMNAALCAEDLCALREQTPLGRLGTPEEAARAILFFAQDAAFITGQVLGVDGGFVI